MKKDKLLLAAATIATAYSGYKIYKYRTSEPEMSASERLFVGFLGTLGIGYFIYFSTTDNK